MCLENMSKYLVLAYFRSYYSIAANGNTRIYADQKEAAYMRQGIARLDILSRRTP